MPKDWTKRAAFGRCPVCRERRKLTPKGTLHTHFLASYAACPGTGRAPAD